MSKLADELRRKAAEMKAAKPVASAPKMTEKAIAAFPPKKNVPPVVGTEIVKCLCGHEAIFPLFADKQDKYRNERRKKLTDKACSECRQKANVEKMAKDKEAKAIRDKEKAERIAANPMLPKQWGRLPHRSTFYACYDADRVMWAGTLTIFNGVTVAKVFEAEVSAVFRLFRALDKQYRKWAVEQEKLKEEKEPAK